jgi:hypothetical protein
MYTYAQQPLLNNGSVNNSRCCVIAATVPLATAEEIIGEVFSLLSVSKCYKQDELNIGKLLDRERQMRPDLSSERTPQKDKTANFRKQPSHRK